MLDKHIVSWPMLMFYENVVKPHACKNNGKLVSYKRAQEITQFSIGTLSKYFRVLQEQDFYEVVRGNKMETLISCKK